MRVRAYADLQEGIRLLEKDYHFDNKVEVENFLKQHPYLLLLLQEGKERIFSTFGKKVKLYLEIHHDPEEGWEELFVVIRSPYNAEEAIRLENKLAEEWFLDRMKETRGKLNITGEPL